MLRTVNGFFLENLVEKDIIDEMVVNKNALGLRVPNPRRGTIGSG